MGCSRDKISNKPAQSTLANDHTPIYQSCIDLHTNVSTTLYKNTGFVVTKAVIHDVMMCCVLDDVTKKLNSKTTQIFILLVQKSETHLQDSLVMHHM